MDRANYAALLETALDEARRGLAEGGIPIGAALFDSAGKLVGSGRNRRVQAKRVATKVIATKLWPRHWPHVGIAAG
jgi:tRNA(Arg) A34 adenosine deaminase TadA